MKLKKDQKLLFIGDSVTDCDRAKPHGEGLFQALGSGYVSLVDSFLQSTYPELGIRTVNKGLSGNTVRDLKARWQEDVLDQNPDWLSVMIGINDVWRQFDSPFIKYQHVYIDEYRETLDELISTTKQSTGQIVLMTPYYIEPNATDEMRATMDRYGEVVKQTAEKHQTYFIDTQAAFNHVLEHLYPATLAWDRVHPNANGHTVLAKAFLNAIEFDWNKK
ncbi:SGNH/GDSL hydrolase family protein [Gracilibacillus salinarum]|uniref:SGNH/GDSL hydrolase family protein n=1 Tax=Gracilibacillus salinarum TaxID=2932255 RepID=A0ABY4GLT1_9BACI|nr:SGNH/GDSL hydrolase family protein [Gracilibacillus salinarum]UOQ85131.1 SGNH/GDSL hydrolase family protein [Gracilibacillus salinarum]